MQYFVDLFPLTQNKKYILTRSTINKTAIHPWVKSCRNKLVKKSTGKHPLLLAATIFGSQPESEQCNIEKTCIRKYKISQN